MLLLHCDYPRRHVIYHGPVSQVQRHFQTLGFELPGRMDVLSWLVEITTASGKGRGHTRDGGAGEDCSTLWELPDGLSVKSVVGSWCISIVWNIKAKHAVSTAGSLWTADNQAVGTQPTHRSRWPTGTVSSDEQASAQHSPCIMMVITI